MKIVSLLFILVVISACSCPVPRYKFNGKLFHFKFSLENQNTIEFDSRKGKLKITDINGSTKSSCCDFTFAETKMVFDFLEIYQAHKTISSLNSENRYESLSPKVRFNFYFYYGGNEYDVKWQDFSYTELDALAMDIFRLLENKNEFQELLNYRNR